MLFLLVGLTVLLTVFNYYVVARKDYLYPSFLLCLFFLVSELTCVLGIKAFAITFDIATVIIVTVGLLVFTVIGYLFNRNDPEFEHKELKEIKIHPVMVALLLIIEAATVYFFYDFLQKVSYAYDAKYRSFSETIELFHTITGFWDWMYAHMGLRIPMIYRVGEPIASAGSYIALYVIVNNYLYNKKIRITHVLAVVLNVLVILMNGSRSPLLRILTFMIAVFFVLGYRSGKIRKGDARLLLITVGVLGTAAVLMVVMLRIIRPNVMENLFRYVFVYVGGPLLNFNNWVRKFNWQIPEGLFGAQTFMSLYNYVGKLLHIDSFIDYRGINGFVFTDNGIDMGNVFTYFHKIIYDFSYYGLVPLTALMALYYCLTYRKLKQGSKGKLDFRLFVYAYLLNDLIMSIFSCRFYETIGGAPFIKWIILSLVLDFIVVENKVPILNKIFSTED